MSQFINTNINNIIVNIIILVVVADVVIDNVESMIQKQKSVQSVRRTQVTGNPKMNYIHFSAIELGFSF